MSKKAKTKKKKNQSLSSSQMAILGVLALAGGILLFRFFGASSEGLSHFAKAELNIVSPDFEASEKEAKKVPDFILQDRKGNKVKLSQFDAIDVLVVNIWSSGCPVCRQEIPSLTELDRRLSHEEGVELLTIAVAESWDEVMTYFPRGTNLRILFDKEDSVGNGVFKTDKYPETFILDKSRRVRARFDGIRNWHSDTFINYVNSFR